MSLAAVRRTLVPPLIMLALTIGYILSFDRTNESLPVLLQGLPTNFEEAGNELQARLDVEFAPPFPEVELVHQLQQQGISVDTENRFARFRKGDFACTYIWDIWWQSEDAMVTSFDAQVGAICL